ncbi:hypothetical protein BGZ80_007853 [Entomortierella chlamydospora]|uniref:Uncharacterized protein n=1 Tax=Entomortierella chlamydospora TaxID=101097 RepID=A0A9P6N4T6_9FUNG|nr:hypothetical protein BGZ80_007853 [Entomortierella chlamydospora]
MDQQAYIKWALQEVETEHVTIRAFAEKFSYTDRHTAETAYLSIINCTEIPKPRRNRLLQSLATFNANAAETFWTKRATVNKVGVITMKAAVDSVEAGHQQSKIIYRNHFGNEEADRQDAQNELSTYTYNLSTTFGGSNHSANKTMDRFYSTTPLESPRQAPLTLADLEQHLNSTPRVLGNPDQALGVFGTENERREELDRTSQRTSVSLPSINALLSVSPDTSSAEATSPFPVVPPTPAPLTSTDESGDTSESEQLLDRERDELLHSVDESNHPSCDWRVNGACMACLFADYRRVCINALVARDIKKTDVGDLMAVIGVFAPTLATKRMNESFSQLQLKSAQRPKPELPDIEIDDANIMKAVRFYLKDKSDEVEVSPMAGNKKLRIMLESLLEYLPSKEDKTASESSFTVKYVAPIIQAYVDLDGISSDFPNTNSSTQKHQNLRADRPDLRAKFSGQEILWGEITGPTQAGCKVKNLWDMYKLARFGKAFIVAGNDSAPLVQIIGSLGTYMRLYMKMRGVMILEEVGTFVVPTYKAMIPSLVATLPTLELLKV